MPTLTVLPAGPTPKALTAKSASRTLQEHLLSFENVHNPDGFVNILTEHVQEESVATYLLRLAQEQSLSKKQLQTHGFALKRLARLSTLQYSQILELIAKLYGFNTYHAARTYSETQPDGQAIYNRYYHLHAQPRVFNASQTKYDFKQQIKRDFPK